MATPILLEGNNLGLRHLHLNRLVNDAFDKKVPFELIRKLKEYSEVDRVFKINIANKYKNVDYILENLASENMLYVSTALQSTWIITDSTYENIFNPTFLHDKLYPTMQTPAVSKTAHAIERHLKDEKRCQIFYQYYAERNSDTTMKYLPKCSPEFILEELKTNQVNPSPHLLKKLCEKNPHVAEYYFKYMVYEGDAAQRYYGDQEKFLTAVKFLLKTHPDIYLDILERLHLQWFDKLSKDATHFVMKTQYKRFEAKPELYSVWILNLDVVALYLNETQLKELIMKLARAEYLSWWFTYKNAEPLLKRLQKEGKSAFVKCIFVEKDFGPLVKDPPYEFPKAPEQKRDSELEFRAMTKKRKYCAWQTQSHPAPMAMACLQKRSIQKRSCKIRYRTLMDDLYDAYRFANFSKTFFELRKRIQGEPNHLNRQIMLTVLITKSKNNEQNIKSLLEYFLEKHLNEPITLKCSFARTIVNQAKAYKFTEETWALLESVFYNIGVFHECKEDISTCIEAIIIYYVLNQREVPESIIEKYFDAFSTFYNYSLNLTEKSTVFNFVFSLIHDKIENGLDQGKPSESLKYTWHMISLLNQWNKPLVNYTSVLELIKRTVTADEKMCGHILTYIYDKLKGQRKMFFRELFNLKQNEESYINTLKHDMQVLVDHLTTFDRLMDSGSEYFHHEAFLRKVTIYFGHDLAIKYINQLEEKIDTLKNSKDTNRVARALCLLNSPKVADVINRSTRQLSTNSWAISVPPLIEYVWGFWTDIVNRLLVFIGLRQEILSPPLDTNVVSAKCEECENGENKKQVNFNKIICKHLFLINPPIEVSTLILLKQAATIPLTTICYRHPKDWCRTYIEKLLTGPQQFVKLAVRLAFKKFSGNEILEVCRTVWTGKKSDRLKLILFKETYKHICTVKNFPPQLWEFLKLVIENLKLTQKEQTYSMLSTIKSIPDSIKADYCETVYNYFTALKKTKFPKEYSHEWRTEIVKYIDDHIGQFPSQFLHEIIEDFLTEMRLSKEIKDDFFYDEYNGAMLDLIPNYLLSCETLDEQLRRYESTAKPFLEIIKALRHKEMKMFAFHFLMMINYYMDFKRLDATPVLKSLATELENSMPFEQNFDFYVSMRMSLVHAYTIKTVADELKDSAGEYSVGDGFKALASRMSYQLGKNMAGEVERICSEYKLTPKDLMDVCAKNFQTQFRKYSWIQHWQLSFVEGLISNTTTTNGILFAIEFLASRVYRVELKNESKFTKIIQTMKDLNNREVKTCMYTNLTDHIFGLVLLDSK